MAMIINDLEKINFKISISQIEQWSTQNNNNNNNKK